MCFYKLPTGIPIFQSDCQMNEKFIKHLLIPEKLVKIRPVVPAMSTTKSMKKNKEKTLSKYIARRAGMPGRLKCMGIKKVLGKMIN